MTKILDKLHPHEKKILLALRELGPSEPSKIAEKTGLPESAVHKAGQWSKLKGLVDYQEKKTTETTLTPEGKRYLRNGLPEKTLLKKLKEGKSDIKDLKKEHKQLDIALAWAKKKGWVEINKGRLLLTYKGKEAINKETDVEKGLKGEVTEESLKELRHRKLVDVKETVQKKLILTPEGEKAASSIKTIKEEIGQLTPTMIKTRSWKNRKFRKYDVNTPVPVVSIAKLHPYTQFINRIRNKLVSLGFMEVKGPYVETEFWNLDALLMPQDHPARGLHDIFSIKTFRKGTVKNRRALKRVAETHKNGWITGSSGWGFWNQKQTLNLVMRSQNTAVSVRTLSQKPKIPGKYFTIDKVFRPDEIDATHFIEFNQLEGIVLSKNLTLKHLFGYLKMFGKEIAGAEKVRFRPSYFPFTEPSVELDCLINGEWVEVGGAGIFRKEVTMPLGIDVPVIAWGLGLERLSMIKLGVSDIRHLYNDDLEWLRKRRMV